VLPDFRKPFGSFSRQGFFYLWPSGLKTQSIDAGLALLDGHLTIFTAAAPT